MAATFNPLKNGRWDPDRPVQQLDAFAVTIAATGQMQATLSIRSKTGERFDFMMTADDAEEVGGMLAGVAKVLANNPQLAAELQQAEDEGTIPYGRPN